LTGITVKPRYPRREAEYAVEIEEIVSRVIFDYDNDGGNVGDTTLVTDTKAPSWGEPPDLFFMLAFPTFKANLDNTWVREGSTFSKSGETVADVNTVRWEVLVDSPKSIKSCKVYNPFGYTMRFELWAAASDKSDSSQLGLWYVQPNRGIQFDCVQMIEELVADGDVYLKAKCYLYDEDITDNYIIVDSTAETWTIGFPDADPKYGVPIGPSIMFDLLNVIDRYGITITAISAISSAVATQVSALESNPQLGTIASSLGVSAASLAGTLGLGLAYNWLTFADIQEFVIPAIASVSTAAVGAYMSNRYSSKFLGPLGAAVAGIGNAGAVMAILAMIDDMKISLEM
jgi:hypothetical protein